MPTHTQFNTDGLKRKILTQCSLKLRNHTIQRHAQFKIFMQHQTRKS